MPGCRIQNLSDDYCCGFDSLDQFNKTKIFYDRFKPAAPIKMNVGDEEYWPRGACPESRFDKANHVDIGQYSAAGALLLAPQHAVVRNLLTHGAPEVVPATDILIFVAIYFILAAMTSGAWIPSGLVLPMMIMGACVGRLCGIASIRILGEALYHREALPWVPEVQNLIRVLDHQQVVNPQDAGVLAMVGAAAFMSGSGSLVLFVIVLMLELTLDPFLTVVVALAALTARCTAHFLGSKGLYHELIDVQSLPFLHEHEHWRQRSWVVEDVLKEDQKRNMFFMHVGSTWYEETNIDIRVHNLPGPEGRNSPQATTELSTDGEILPANVRAFPQALTPITVNKHTTIARIRSVLTLCLPGDAEPLANGFPVVEDNGVLCGLVTRRDLQDLLHHNGVSDVDRHHLGRSLLGLSAPQRTGSLPAYGSNDLFEIDIGTVMDAAPFIVQRLMPVHQAFLLFRQLGLRHVVVVDDNHKPLGVLTRKSLMPWRTPWQDRGYGDHDTFAEVREFHIPSPRPSRG